MQVLFERKFSRHHVSSYNNNASSDNSKVKKYCCISVMICMTFLKQNLLALGETLAYHDKNLAILSLAYEYMYILNTCECVYVCIHNLGIVLIGRVS